MGRTKFGLAIEILSHHNAGHAAIVALCHLKAVDLGDLERHLRLERCQYLRRSASSRCNRDAVVIVEDEGWCEAHAMVECSFDCENKIARGEIMCAACAEKDRHGVEVTR